MRPRNVGPLVIYTRKPRLKLWQAILIAFLLAAALSIEWTDETEQKAVRYVCSELGCAASNVDIPGE